MKIDGRLFVVMLAITALTLCAVCAADEGDAASGKTVSVYADVDGRVVEMTGAGSDLPSAIENAVGKAGYEVNLGPANIVSFNGQDAPSGKYWTVQQWLPPEGWKVVTFNSTPANFVEGTSYYLYLAERATVDGYSTYTSPEYEPEAKAYFFIQFKEDINANSYVTSVLTEDQRAEGFWVSGTGSNAAWAFKDACERLGFELDMSDGVKGDVVDYNFIGWLNSFLGLEDELLSGSTMDGSWKYWSQFYWDEGTGSWVYGETMGHYDPSVTKYFALIRQITTKDNVLTNLDQDPSDAPLSKVNGTCTVRFVDGNGTTIKTQSVPYFGSATAPSNPTKDPSNGITYTFTGWDREFDQVISDMTVTAQFESSSGPVDPDGPGTSVSVTGVTITGGQKELDVGDTCKLSASVTPSNATNKAVTWSTSNPGVATVDSTGTVSAVGEGTATITVTTADGGKTAFITLTVSGQAEYISLSSSFLAMQKGDSVVLIATSNDGAVIEWSSSDTGVATVDQYGEVTVKSDSGSAVITASTRDGLTASCKIVVISKDNVDEITRTDMEANDSGVYTIEFTESHLKALSDAGESYTLNTVLGSVTLSNDVLKVMDSEGNLTVSLATLNGTQAGIVKDVAAYEYRLNDGNTTQLGGKATIKMPYTLKTGEDPNDIRVYHIDSRGNLEGFDCTYSDGNVTFETTHFSVYFATSDDISGEGGSEEGGSEDGDSNTLMYVAIAIAVIAVAAIAIVAMRRHA